MTQSNPDVRPDVHAAIVRMEESKATHVAWVKHLKECFHCQEYPPKYIQSIEEHQEIIAGYDNVLTVLDEYEKWASFEAR